MLESMIGLGVLSIILTALFIVVRCVKGSVYGLLTKIIASFSFICLGIMGLIYSNNVGYSLLVILGLISGLIGDILLDLKPTYKEHNDIYLNSGMISFGIGHLFYLGFLIFFSHKIVNLLVPILVSIAIGIVFAFLVLLLSKPLKMELGKFKWQSTAYAFILSFVCALSIYISILLSATFLYLMAIGLALILISDLILSQQYFGGKENNKLMIVLNHSIYYSGQILIALSIFLI